MVTIHINVVGCIKRSQLKWLYAPWVCRPVHSGGTWLQTKWSLISSSGSRNYTIYPNPNPKSKPKAFKVVGKKLLLKLEIRNRKKFFSSNIGGLPVLVTNVYVCSQVLLGGRTKIHWRDSVSHLVWQHIGLLLQWLDKSVTTSNSKLDFTHSNELKHTDWLHTI